MSGGSNKLLTANETAQMLGVSRDWLYRNWRAVGLKAKDMSRPGAYRKTLRFSERDVEQWIERNSA